jgi:phosphoribosylaminoimidazolecarboxamide formyltransferase/IMP cyclohydrolase
MSVSNKTGLPDFAAGLAELGWSLVASGGSKKALEATGLDVVAVEQVTHAPEMLGGRVKTLHPAIHAGILARDTDDDLNQLGEAGYAPIDLVVCNLYPFQDVIRNQDVSLADAIEHIDIGGVTLLRAAAKNFARVTVIVDPADYLPVLEEIRAEGRPSEKTRRDLAIKAFAHTRDYDTAISSYLSDTSTPEHADLGESFTLHLKQAQELRYGENPHQNAGYFADSAAAMPLGCEQLAGKPLSYNNILDADAAWRAVCSFDAKQEAAVVIVKHLTPTGIAVGASPEAAFPFALESDSLSAFGGVIAVNQAVNMDFVEGLGELFVEVIIAPEFADDAREALVSGRKNCRLLKISSNGSAPRLEFRSVLGGVLIQERDGGDPVDADWKVVSKRAPTDDEADTLRFAWIAVQHVKSNAIVLARQGATVGIGGGLPSRVDAVKLAVEKAGKQSRGAVLASDAFFPFPDAVEAAAEAGVTAIIQPGGALRDQTVIDAADEAGIAMVLTGVRHFRH